jgi:hypothetical protein
MVATLAVADDFLTALTGKQSVLLTADDRKIGVRDNDPIRFLRHKTV